MRFSSGSGRQSSRNLKHRTHGHDGRHHGKIGNFHHRSAINSWRGLEPLEPRLLLSAAVPFTGVLPDTNVNPGIGEIHGSVFVDTDRDGLLDPTEESFGGRLVYLDLNDNQQRDPGENAIVASADGFVLTGVTPGQYIVRSRPNPGWTTSLPAPEDAIVVTVPADGGVAGVHFGHVPAPTEGAFDLGIVVNDLSLPAAVAGSRRQRIEVFVTNHGETAFNDVVSIELRAMRDNSLTGSSEVLGRVERRLRIEPGETARVPTTISRNPDQETRREMYIRARLAPSDTYEHGVSGNDVDLSSMTTDFIPLLPEFETALIAAGLIPPNFFPGDWGGGLILDSFDIASFEVALANGSGIDASLRGRVFTDPNTDHRFDRDVETGLSGWTVFVDRDDDGRIDSNEERTTTDGTGFWRLNASTPGSGSRDVSIRVIAPEGFEGWFQQPRPSSLTNGDHFRLSLSSGAEFSILNFGVFARPVIESIDVPDLLINGETATITANNVTDMDSDIGRVAFYRSLSESGHAQTNQDDLLGVDTDGSDGYSIQIDPLHWGVTGKQTVYAIAEDVYANRSAQAQSQEITAAHKVTMTNGERVRYIDKEGTAVTMTLRRAEIDLLVSGDGIDIIDLGRETIITGAAQIDQIRIVDGSQASNLTFVTRSRTRDGDTAATVGSIVGDQVFGSIQGRSISLIGDGIQLTGDGVIGRMMFRRVLADIVMPGELDRGGLNLTALSIEGANITTASMFQRVLATENVRESAFTAPSINLLSAQRGDIRDLTLNLTDASARTSITSLTARNRINHLEINAEAPVGRLMSQLGDITDASIDAPSLTQITANRGAMRDVSLTLADPSARQAVRIVRAGGDIDGLQIDAGAPVGNVLGESIAQSRIEAPAANTIRATHGDITELDLLLTDPSARRSLGSLVTRGWLTESTINAASEVATVLAGAMRGSAIRVGVNANVTGMPTTLDDFASESKLRNVRVTGIRGDQTSSFIDSYVAAWDITSVNVGSATSEDATRSFGVAAGNLGRVRGLGLATVELV